MRKRNRKAGCNVVRSEGDPGACPQATAVARAGPAQHGFSLVEVLVAVGIAATVLISICGLFILGSQNVAAGANLSTATTVAQSTLEQMRGMSAEEIYGVMNGQPEDRVRTWDTDQPNPTYTERNLEHAADFNIILNDWRDTVREALPRGVMILTVEGFDDRPLPGDDGTATFGGARFLRIQITMHWTELRSHGRQVTMNLLKF
jgi:prepilin-type N-terminal cleavage/methylation domain-containing protein